MIDLVQKVGGGLAIVGTFVGAWLWYPKCDVTGEQCSNILGEVPLNAVQMPDTTQLMLTGGGIGALTGAALAFLIIWIWPHITKKDLGMME